MPVFNDGTNYFNGSTAGGGTSLSVAQGIVSAFTTLSVDHDFDNIATSNLNWRPAAETVLTGTIATSDDDVINAGDLNNNARIAHLVRGSNGGGTSVHYVLNSTTTGTEQAVLGNSSIAGNAIQNITHMAGTRSWGVYTNNSVAVFHWLDSDNYYFSTTGVMSQPATYTFPENLFAMYILKSTGTLYKSFRSVTSNSTTAKELHRSGANANFTRVPVSGTVEPGAVWIGRQTSDNYAIGVIPNIVTITRADVDSAGLSVGDFPVNLDNITLGNDNIDGSTQDDYIYVGNLDSTLGDDLGDGVFMRIYTIT